MPKQIVNKEAIVADPCLMFIKAFRISNKRAGEAKRENNMTVFSERVAEIRFLAIDANARGFKIWVNQNGKTGHTYTHDYKLTDEADNNFEAHEARVAAQMAAIEEIRLNALTQSQSSATEPELNEPAQELDETAIDDIEGLDN